MRKFFILVACVCIAFSLSAQRIAGNGPEVGRAEKTAAALSADQEAMGNIADDWKNAYNGGDATKVAALYCEDGYYLSAHILAHGRDAIQAYWQRGIAAGGHIDFIKPLTTFYSGDLGYTAGTYQATNAGVTVDGRILIVLKKVNGRWLVAAHETVVRDQP
jgi:ketosteroid isomerase-like protein